MNAITPSPIAQQGGTIDIGALARRINLLEAYAQDPNNVAFTGGAIGGPIGSILTTNLARKSPRRRLQLVHASPPTITYSASAPVAGRTMLLTSNNVQVMGTPILTPGSGLQPFGNLAFSGTSAYAGFEAEFTGDVLVLGWRCGVAAAERVMVYVDGQPCMATAATPSVVTVAGTLYYVTLTFASVAKRRVEVLVTNANAFVAMWIPVNGAICPTPAKQTIMLVGDSFLGGSAAITDNSLRPGPRLQTMLDINLIESGLGGTGYASAGSFVAFGAAARVSLAAAAQPDKIVFMGSVNDDAVAGVQTAASACFAAYRVAAPNAELIVFGPQPNAASATLTASRQTNVAAVKAAAVAAGATFYDMIGIAAAIPAAFSTGTTYQFGDTVTSLGSVWTCTFVGGATFPGGGPGVSKYWDLVTADWYGTGQVGTTAGNGNRDVLLWSDGIHPTELGCGVIAERLAIASSL